jgi:hypothetical protein
LSVIAKIEENSPSTVSPSSIGQAEMMITATLLTRIHQHSQVFDGFSGGSRRQLEAAGALCRILPAVRQFTILEQALVLAKMRDK